MLIILKDEQEAQILGDILSATGECKLKGAILSTATYLTDENGKYSEIKYKVEGVKNE